MRRFLRRRVDPSRLGHNRGSRRLSHEARGMTGVGGEERVLPRRGDLRCEPVVNRVRRHQANARVPVVVFLSEDYFEVGRFGDRLLSAYRAKGAKELVAACAT